MTIVMGYVNFKKPRLKNLYDNKKMNSSVALPY